MATYPRKRKLPIAQFVRDNRAIIDRAIAQLAHMDATYIKANPLTDNERRLWVLNDESLYLWARKEGVNI